MRVLVACSDCARQFDASGRPPGSRLRCLCGKALTVPEPHAHDAAVVRCSSCGAPRQEAAAACGFCGADFTLRERDLHTLCPICMARVSDRARYCHHCATALLPQPLGPATEHRCPACGEGAALTSRHLEDGAVPILECQRCAGLWFGRAAFQVVLDRARRDSRTADDREASGPLPLAPHQGAAYRPCPECGDLMHRRNYGRRSGVIVDTCVRHGLWFDARELEALLSWVRRGGEVATAERQQEERTRLDRQRRLLREGRYDSVGPDPADENPPLLLVLAYLLRRLLG